jgi:hypothetical protein
MSADTTTDSADFYALEDLLDADEQAICTACATS